MVGIGGDESTHHTHVSHDTFLVGAGLLQLRLGGRDVALHTGYVIVDLANFRGRGGIGLLQVGQLPVQLLPLLLLILLLFGQSGGQGGAAAAEILLGTSFHLRSGIGGLPRKRISALLGVGCSLGKILLELRDLFLVMVVQLRHRSRHLAVVDVQQHNGDECYGNGDVPQNVSCLFAIGRSFVFSSATRQKQFTCQ